jgi:ribonuclease HII
MSAEERLKAYAWITAHCRYQIGIVHHRIIDQHNIWHATILAMKKALVNLLAQLNKPPGAILVDAMPLKLSDTGFYDIPVYHFPKGEQKSSSIAAASIVAKVTRDALMEKYETLFPGYDLKQHKGYATKIHQNHIHELGHSIIHRESFLGAFHTEIETDDGQQQMLF